VDYQIVSTHLTHELRRKFDFVERQWQEVNPESTMLRNKLHELLTDLGAFLDSNIYREAITHFVGGREKVVQLVDVISNRKVIGKQPAHLLTSDTAFSFTSTHDNHARMREHQIRFLRHTRLKAIQWVNFNQHLIEFETLSP
jgi:hypothetical protein